MTKMKFNKKPIQAYIQVLIGDVAIVIFPIVVLLLIKLVFNQFSLIEIVSSSKLSFGLVVLQTLVLTKFLELKINQKDFSYKFHSGAKSSVLVLIAVTIIFIFSLLEEMLLFPDSGTLSRLRILSSLNILFFILTIATLIAFEKKRKFFEIKLNLVMNLCHLNLSVDLIYINES